MLLGSPVNLEVDLMAESVSVLVKGGKSGVVFVLEELAEDGVKGGVCHLLGVVVTAIFRNIGESFHELGIVVLVAAISSVLDELLETELGPGIEPVVHGIVGIFISLNSFGDLSGHHADSSLKRLFTDALFHTSARHQGLQNHLHRFLLVGLSLGGV